MMVFTPCRKAAAHSRHKPRNRVRLEYRLQESVLGFAESAQGTSRSHSRGAGSTEQKERCAHFARYVLPRPHVRDHKQ